ncbi:hypothetical protein GDO86_007280 [Hymenochirus boettgeri]|uniref:Pentraxin (PTX) domain-containing protein n=1 Tax=Hymenochirus boettgeri TaxID=247094 RepID=A0A8T2IYJ8_9PIPI|nr:hypothetical protein GDO86_007280 [Hymenochirus boettgeri]
MALSIYFIPVLLCNIFVSYNGVAPNVALHKITTQSSTIGYYGNSRNANDGSLANNYLRSQCSKTNKEADPWWMVDLQNPHHILSVAVTNRVLECCREMIFGTEIRIGNNPNQGGRLNPRCAVISSIESGETISFSCHGMIGQYVSLSIPGREENLVLCEVQVFGLPVSSSAPNVAVKGIAHQSSLKNMYGESKNAIDGSLSSNFFFIELMLYISRAEIRIGPSNEEGGTKNPICGIIKSMANGETLAFECNGMEGQYVTVFIPGTNKTLTICEVQVFGLPSDGKCSGLCVYRSLKDDRQDLADPVCHLSMICNKFPDCVSSGSSSLGENLAFRGITSQSSTYDKFGAAENAIDGSPNTRYMSGHCSHTDLDISPWWRVDLMDIYNITTVKITNRGDCCNERINAAEIRIGTEHDDGGTRNPRCVKIQSIDLGKEETYICGIVGRYVTVTIPGKAAYLTLCEVKVYGHEVSENYTSIIIPPDSEEVEEQKAAQEMKKMLKHSNAAFNVALRGTAYQSSTEEEGEPEKAVDGSLQSRVPSKHCSKTTVETDPWWTVDLKSSHKIWSVAVTRADCCSEELDGAEIHLGDSAFSWKKNPICGTISKIGFGETYSFNCNGMEGRFVTIVLPGDAKSLTLCEVQIFGVPAEAVSGEWIGDLEQQKLQHGAKNMAPQGIPLQSSYYGRKEYAKRAIDGSLGSNYQENQCAHTQKELQPWWHLDLRSRMRVHSVAITNRGDCCRERINGAEIHIGNSKTNGGISNPRCGVVFRMGYGETISYDCKGMEGQYVTITIPDRNEFLTLCEVQVFADPLDSPLEGPALELQLGDELSEIIGVNEDLTKKHFLFPQESDNSYVSISPAKPMQLKAFTLCMNVSLEIPKGRETILFSYRTLFYDALNLWIEKDGNIGLYMSGDGLIFRRSNLKKVWNHLCVTWESRSGRTELWLNGKRASTNVYQRRHHVSSGGIAMLGQDQDALESEFDSSQSYIGKIKDVNMWSKVLSLRSLKSLFKGKNVHKGTIFDWSSFSFSITGNVTLNDN